MKKPIKVLKKVLKNISLVGYGKKYSGKVRDFYIKDNKRILITTDRQSAFDVILGHIPYKGAVLNQLAAFWFKKTKHIIPNHLISTPDPNVTIAHEVAPIPVEMVVRGYLSGVTTTSVWYSYQQGEREIYGIKFPNNMIKNQKLPQPIITPTTHGGGKGGHDERLTRAGIIKKKIVSEKIYKQMEEAALKLFAYGSTWCKRHGLVLVDSKYEFGLHKGKLILMDELHTPDSSRFWKADTYETRIKKGLEPENFDKEFLRLFYVEKFNYRGDGPAPAMPEELAQRLSERYIKVYEMLTGKQFEMFEYPIKNRILYNIQTNGRK